VARACGCRNAWNRNHPTLCDRAPATWQEGVFGWAAANYAAGTLDKHDPAQTVGVLELGGASSQVTFAPTSAEDIPKDLEQRVTLGGTQFTLYTHSFLGLGQEAAQEALASAVLRGSASQVGSLFVSTLQTTFSWALCHIANQANHPSVFAGGSCR